MKTASRRGSAVFVVLTSLAMASSHGALRAAPQAASKSAAIEDPKRITFEHDGKDVSGFVLYLSPENGTPLRVDLGALKPDGKGIVSAQIPPLPAGHYRVEIAAYNVGGESPRVPANPPEFSVTKSMATAPATMSEHSMTGGSERTEGSQASGPPPTDAKPAERSKSDNSGKKPGAGKRLWRLIVGDDD